VVETNYHAAFYFVSFQAVIKLIFSLAVSRELKQEMSKAKRSFLKFSRL
jgi:hypothetical protein